MLSYIHKNQLVKFRKVSVKIVLLFLTVTSLSACSLQRWKEHELSKSGLLSNSQGVKVYFTKSKSSQGLSVLPVKRRVSKEDNLVDASLKELFLGPTQEELLKGIMTEIPVGTRLIKVEEAEDEVFIDISSQFLTGGGSATMQLRYLQMYKTLKNICPNKKLYLNVEGKTLKTIGGEGLEVKQPLGKINDYTKKYKRTKDLQP